MLLANYASDSGSDSDSEPGSSRPPASATAKSTISSSGSHSKPLASVSTPVSNPGSKGKRKGPVKITLDLPKPSGGQARGQDESDANSDEGAGSEDGKAEMKVRPTASGLKGKGSSLLGMLPPPKRKQTMGTTKSQPLRMNKSMAAKPKTPIPAPKGMPDLSGIHPDAGGDDDGDGVEAGDGGMLVPPFVSRGKIKNVSKDQVDLFGLSASAPFTKIPPASTTLRPPTISSAPAIPDFVPPEPTSSDPYPGYYQLSSGQWAAYDPDYYHSFFPESSSSSDAQDTFGAQGDKKEDGRVGHHWDEYESKGANVLDIDVNEGLKRAREEQERVEKLKRPKVAGEEYEYKAIGQTKGLAAQRHQLTSLLNTAYSQREELEERIAQNKKNMRMAGQKYGF